MTIFKTLEPLKDPFENVQDIEYTGDEVANFFITIFDQRVLLAFKYLRGGSYLDPLVMDALLCDPQKIELIEEGLKWIHDNYEHFPDNFLIDFNVYEEHVGIYGDEDDDSDYYPSEDDDDDDEDPFENNPEFWDQWFDDEPEYVDF